MPDAESPKPAKFSRRFWSLGRYTYWAGKLRDALKRERKRKKKRKP